MKNTIKACFLASLLTVTCFVGAACSPFGNSDGANQQSVTATQENQVSEGTTAFTTLDNTPSSEPDEQQSEKPVDNGAVNHSVVSSSDVVLATDDAINSNDVKAQRKLDEYFAQVDTESLGNSMSNDYCKATVYPQGNAFVYEMTLTFNLTGDSEADATLQKTVETSSKSVQRSFSSMLSSAKRETSVDNLVIVVAYCYADGSLCSSFVCKN